MKYVRQQDPVSSGVKYSILNNATIGLPPESSGFRKVGSFVVNMDGTEVYRSNGMRLSLKKDGKGNLIIDIPTYFPVYMASLVYRAFSGDLSRCTFRNIVFIDGCRSNCGITNLTRRKPRKVKSEGAKPAAPMILSNVKAWRRVAAVKALEASSSIISVDDATRALRTYAESSKPGLPIPEKYNDYLRVLYVSGMSIKEIAVLCKTRQGNVWEVVK